MHYRFQDFMICKTIWSPVRDVGVGIMGIKGMTKVYGLFGDPVEHSLSPIMHNTAFQALGLDCVYLPFLVQSKDIGSAVQAVRALHLGGVNLTIPLKERVLPYLDEVEKEASSSVRSIPLSTGMVVCAAIIPMHRVSWLPSKPQVSIPPGRKL